MTSGQNAHDLTAPIPEPAARAAGVEFDVMYRLAHDLARTLDLATIAQRVLTWAQELLGADYVDVMMADPGTTILCGVANTVDTSAYLNERIDATTELAIVSQIFRSKKPVVIDDFGASPLISTRLKQDYPALRATWGVPLMSGEVVVGVLCAAYTSDQKITADKVQILQLLGDEAALALERARLTDSLHKQTTELRRANAELEQFVHAASHDLKEPLRGIRHYADFLSQDCGASLNEDSRLNLAALQRLSAHMELLLDSLLDFSRLSQAFMLESNVDLDAALADALEMVHMRLRESAVEVRVRGPLGYARGNRERISEIFINLLSNAVKYNDKPHQWIEIGKQAPTARHHEQERDIVLYVRDNGIGIASKNLEQVFRIFRRLHPRDAYGGGTGVGLALTRKLVDSLGGRTWIESEVGQGSACFFTLSPSQEPPPGNMAYIRAT